MDDETKGIGSSGGALGALLGGAAIPTSATGILAIDLGALRTNYRTLRDLASPAECAAVVKSDGYGIGAAEAGRTLAAEIGRAHV